MKTINFLKHGAKILFAVILMNAICPEKAHAYLDPGTGSMILQVIIAAIAGIGCTFKVWKEKLFCLIKKPAKAPKDSENKE